VCSLKYPAHIYRHETRKVIFVGDFLDRGPEQKEALRVARNEAGTAAAVLGNHEFNAICRWRPDNQQSMKRTGVPVHVADNVIVLFGRYLHCGRYVAATSASARMGADGKI
jgi:hypothetical protein